MFRSRSKAGGRTAAIACALVVAVAGCGGGGIAIDREVAFGQAVEASLDEEWAQAAGSAHVYLREASPDDARYDRAMMLLAKALEQLGLTHAAALYYLDIAESRRNVELLDEAVGALERLVRGGPHDAEGIVAGFVATAEITGIRPELEGFVAYEQGLHSLRRGLDGWADQRLATIPVASPYGQRARFAKAVRSLSRADYAAAKSALDELAQTDGLPTDLVTDVRLALARLALEQGEYSESIRHYEKVRRLAPQRPELLLEMAWAHFYDGDSRRALGLLVALDAPVYRGLIAPERYLLEAFCLRRLCQFEPARTAAARLDARYGSALAELHAGTAPAESATIRQAAQRRGLAGDAHRFTARLRSELERVEDLEGGLGAELSAALTIRYRTSLNEAARAEAALVVEEAERIADELVAAEDGVRLILHELSVALMRGRRRPTGAAERPAVELTVGGNRVLYQFRREFWTDELDDLAVVIPDRCME